MLIDTQASSMKISRVGARSGWHQGARPLAYATYPIPHPHPPGTIDQKTACRTISGIGTAISEIPDDPISQKRAVPRDHDRPLRKSRFASVQQVARIVRCLKIALGVNRPGDRPEFGGKQGLTLMLQQIEQNAVRQSLRHDVRVRLTFR